MSGSGFTWAAPGWLIPGGILLALGCWLLARGYARDRLQRRVSPVLPVLKGAGMLLLVLCLAEPTVQGTRARRGQNAFVVLADDSRSMSVRDGRAGRSRLETMQALLTDESPWMQKVAEDFELRRYAFDTRLRAVRGFDELGGTGEQTALGAALGALKARFEGTPLAGILLLSDGVATDSLDPAVLRNLPAPVYPVLIDGGGEDTDLAMEQVTVSLSHFESAPVTIQARAAQRGYRGRDVLVELLDQTGARVDAAQVRAGTGREVAARFEMRPSTPGLQFYRVQVSASGEAGDSELTLENNSRTVAVDRGGGPYRVLYVSGRPNWEFKYLRRALDEDGEVDLVGLLRIARREPKFEFRGRRGETTNPIFRGFGNQEDDAAEQYDEPVLIRIGTEDEHELRSGFPRDAEELFRYDALILDDVEAAFFTRDQLNLIRDFVSRRGGGFMMLGGAESFEQGRYGGTPIADLLPVYLDGAESEGPVRLEVTREGLAQPWVRLRKTEGEERERLEAMPWFATINRLRGIKPGAVVLGRATGALSEPLPALVTHRFGRGRAAAVTVGDLWRWSLQREEQQRDDPALFWRQAVRWLVAAAPRRVEVTTASAASEPGAAVRLEVRVRDRTFEPMDHASVAVSVTGPDGKVADRVAEPSAEEAGLYTVSYTPRAGGGYRAAVRTAGPDGKRLPAAEAGWVAEPGANEFRSLTPDRALLERLAEAGGGEMLAPEELGSFASRLPYLAAPETEVSSRPLWHRWPVLLLAVGCLAGEWGLRRWKGLP